MGTVFVSHVGGGEGIGFAAFARLDHCHTNEETRSQYAHFRQKGNQRSKEGERGERRTARVKSVLRLASVMLTGSTNAKIEFERRSRSQRSNGAESSSENEEGLGEHHLETT